MVRVRVRTALRMLDVPCVCKVIARLKEELLRPSGGVSDAKCPCVAPINRIAWANISNKQKKNIIKSILRTPFHAFPVPVAGRIKGYKAPVVFYGPIGLCSHGTTRKRHPRRPLSPAYKKNHRTRVLWHMREIGPAIGRP